MKSYLPLARSLAVVSLATRWSAAVARAVRSERGLGRVEVACWTAAASLVLAVAGYVFIAEPGQTKTPRLSPEEQTAGTAVAKRQNAYIIAVVTQQADAYIIAAATQQADVAANPSR